MFACFPSIHFIKPKYNINNPRNNKLHIQHQQQLTHNTFNNGVQTAKSMRLKLKRNAFFISFLCNTNLMLR